MTAKVIRKNPICRSGSEQKYLQRAQSARIAKAGKSLRGSTFEYLLGHAYLSEARAPRGSTAARSTCVLGRRSRSSPTIAVNLHTKPTLFASPFGEACTAPALHLNGAAGPYSNQ